MIEQQYSRFTFFSIFSISIFFGILSHFHLPYQFYIWELFIDSKILAVFLLILFLVRKKAIEIPKIKLLFINWSWKKNILYFFLPLIFYSIVISIGLVFEEVSLNKLDNATTLILATLFDIPAIFIFSSTSVLVEEIFFRGHILNAIMKIRVQWHAILLTTALWVFYSSSEIFGLNEINGLQYIATALYLISFGILCAVLTIKYQSIWTGYSLRIGFITLSPILLTSLFTESDTFFLTESSLLTADGFIVSVLLIVIVLILCRTLVASSEILEEKIEK